MSFQRTAHPRVSAARLFIWNSAHSSTSCFESVSSINVNWRLRKVWHICAGSLCNYIVCIWKLVAQVLRGHFEGGYTCATLLSARTQTERHQKAVMRQPRINLSSKTLSEQLSLQNTALSVCWSNRVCRTPSVLGFLAESRDGIICLFIITTSSHILTITGVFRYAAWITGGLRCFILCVFVFIAYSGSLDN